MNTCEWKFDSEFISMNIHERKFKSQFRVSVTGTSLFIYLWIVEVDGSCLIHLFSYGMYISRHNNITGFWIMIVSLF